MKVHIPNSLYDKAKKVQDEYRKKGLNRPLYECLQELEDGFAGPSPSLNDIKKAVEEAVKKNMPGRNGPGGRWLG